MCTQDQRVRAHAHTYTRVHSVLYHFSTSMCVHTHTRTSAEFFITLSVLMSQFRFQP